MRIGAVIPTSYKCFFTGSTCRTNFFPCFAKTNFCSHGLAPGEVGEGAVGVCHLMGVLALFDGGTLVVVGILQLKRDAIQHAHAATGTGSLDKPHSGQMLLALTLDLKWNLVIGTSDPARTRFHVWLNVLHGLLEHVERIVHLEPGSSFLHATVN